MSTRTSDKRIAEIVGYALQHGDKLACEDFALTGETLARYKRLHRHADPQFTVNATLRKIQEVYSDKELQAIAKGGRILPGQQRVPIVDFGGESVTLGFLTDPHIGSIYFQPEWLEAAFREFDKEEVQFAVCAGDLTDGMSNRPDHIYELTHIGYEKQKAYAVEMWRPWDRPVYMISGNHDRFFIKSSGANIVADVCAELPNAEFLGHDEGDTSVNGITIKTWHGEDGNSYAVSYRLQKIVEAFTGGEKPHILLVGHTHKQANMFERHIHIFSGGCMSRQSRWMRSKRIAAHTGFWIIKFWANKGSVSKIQSTWYPFYA